MGADGDTVAHASGCHRSIRKPPRDGTQIGFWCRSEAQSLTGYWSRTFISLLLPGGQKHTEVGWARQPNRLSRNALAGAWLTHRLNCADYPKLCWHTPNACVRIGAERRNAVQCRENADAARVTVKLRRTHSEAAQDRQNAG